MSEPYEPLVPDELEEELQRLFADERLAIPPAPGASSIVLAGARRVRRRREIAVVTAGSIAAATVLVTGVLVAMPRTDDGNRIAAPPPSTSAESTPSSTSAKPTRTSERKTERPSTGKGSTKPTGSGGGPDTGPTVPSGGMGGGTDIPFTAPVDAGPGSIGPGGYGKLHLGILFEDARPMLQEGAEPPVGCTSYQLSEGTENVGTVLFTESGLVQINASNGKSPQGTGIGSTLEELKTQHPDGTENGSEFTAPAGEGSIYKFVLGEDAVANQFMLIGAGSC